MKKRILALFLSFALIFALLPAAVLTASAETYSGTCGAEGDNLTWTLDTETGVLEISGTGDMDDWRCYDGIYATWYFYRDAIKTVNIGSGVTSIGDYAFFCCTELTSVTIPEGVTSIGSEAFFGCTGLTSVTIPDSVKLIRYHAFSYCTGLTSVSIGSGLTDITGGEFFHCNKLTSFSVDADNAYISIMDGVLYNKDKTTLLCYPGGKNGTTFTIPDGVTEIGLEAFAGCTGLTGVTIGSGVTNIWNYAFWDCTGLTNITISDSVTNIAYGAFNDTGYFSNPFNWTHDVLYIGKYLIASSETISGALAIKEGTKLIADLAFENRAALTGVTFPDSVKYISYRAFYNCTGLTSVSIGNGVTNIDDWAFAFCTGLSSVTIGNSVTRIGGAAFFNCSGLTSVTIPSSVANIDYGAFSHCTGLKSIIVDTGSAYFCSMDGVLYNKDKSTIVRYPVAKSGTSFSIPDSVTSIGDTAFGGCTKLTSVTIPDSVTSIGEEAFGDCSGLMSVTIPDSVTSIGENAFGYCWDNDIVEYAKIDGFTIYGYQGSAAQTYAEENGFIFVDLGNVPCQHEHAYPEHKDATCTQPGYDRTVCDDCGEVLSETVIPALGHAWNDGEITTPATATTDGVKTFTCTRCGETRTEVIPATGEQPCQHEHAYPEHKDATCTEPGYDRMICDDCGEVISETVIPALGHDIVVDVTVAATCTEPGLTAGEHCTRCDYKVAQVVVPALGHDIVVDAEIPATCTATGLSAGEHCTRCDYKVAQQETPALGHDWNEGEITTPATETTDGVKTYTCSRCGGTRTEVIPATGEGACQHGHAYPEDKDATCTEPGYVRMICDDCGAVISEELTPALGHVLVDYDAKAATCTEAGWNAYQACARCDYTTYEEIAALGHDLVDQEAKAPTCTEIGWDAYQTCSRCDYTTYAELPALGHNFVNGVCTVCGAKDPDYKPTNPFGDVKDTDYFYDPVLWAVANGVTKGTSDTTFSPDDTCTRGQVVTFLWRAKGSPEPESTENPFTDIKESDYFYKAVLWAKENKITTGATATTFAPNAGCTRAQVVTFLWRTEGQPKPTSTNNPFKDVTGGYYYDAVLWAVEKNITKGTTDTTFSPDATCTRGQIVTFLYRDLA